MSTRRQDSCIFGTAVVLQALDKSITPRTRAFAQARRRGVGFLVAQMIGPGLFSYYSKSHVSSLPPDVDDTSCASAALSRAHPFFAWRQNLRYLLDSRDSEGRFQTWIEPFSGPNNVDLGVNANLLSYLGEGIETARCVDFVRTFVCDNHLVSKYYPDKLVISYLIARAHEAGVAGLSKAIDVLSEFVESQEADYGWYGSELRTACAILLLAASPRTRRPLTRAVRRLRQAQIATGSWSCANFYRSDAEYFGHEVLTTAVSLHALSFAAARRSRFGN
jgi:hypothetical protein